MSARPILALALPLLLGAAPAGAARAPRPEPTPAPAVEAARAPAPVTVDGRLDDEAWASVPPFTDFTQRDPEEGQPATERTELRLLYDDDALYVGARLLDGEPDRIVKRLSRRDESAEADRFSIYLDPRRDRLTGVRFEVSAAGVQNDEIIYNDTWMDDSWDAVWLSAVHHDEQGWSVEMRIPFSELRFLPGDTQTWGVNASRVIQRKNESDWLALVPKTESGLASRMAELTGIRGVKPRTPLVLVPYAAGGAETGPADPGDPFFDGSHAFGSVGLDLRRKVGSELRPRRHRQPGLRPGRGGPGGREPHRLRDLLPREAPLLRGGSADLRQLRPQRREQLLRVHAHRARPLLHAAHRPRPAGVPGEPSSRRSPGPPRSSAPPSSPGRARRAGASASSRR